MVVRVHSDTDQVRRRHGVGVAVHELHKAHRDNDHEAEVRNYHELVGRFSVGNDHTLDRAFHNSLLEEETDGDTHPDEDYILEEGHDVRNNDHRGRWEARIRGEAAANEIGSGHGDGQVVSKYILVGGCGQARGEKYICNAVDGGALELASVKLPHRRLKIVGCFVFDKPKIT